MSSDLDQARDLLDALAAKCRRCRSLSSHLRWPVKGGHSTGNRGAASATGYQGAASATGAHAVAVAAGHEGRVMGAEGCVLFLIEREETGAIIGHTSVMVGEDGIEPGVWYTLRGGKVVAA